MTERERRERGVEEGIDEDIRRLDEDLEIMDRHAGDLVGVEDEIQDSMRRWDRDHKNAHLHSVPRHLKHVR